MSDDTRALDISNRAIAEAAGLDVRGTADGPLIRYAIWETVGGVTTWRPIPDYLHDVAASLSLWDLVPDSYTPRLVRMLSPRNGEIGFSYKGHIMHNTGGTDFEAYADTPAEAIARAYLAYTEKG